MRRITISMPDELAAALKREARRRAVPASAIARDALSGHLGLDLRAGCRKLGFTAVGHSGQRTTARDMEELLAEDCTGTDSSCRPRDRLPLPHSCASDAVKLVWTYARLDAAGAPQPVDAAA